MQRIISLVRQYRSYFLFFTVYSLLFCLFSRLFIYILPILIGALLAIISLPIYRKLGNKKRQKPNIAARIVTCITASIILLVLISFTVLIIYEIIHLQHHMRYFRFTELHPNVQKLINNALSKITSVFEDDILSAIVPASYKYIPGMLKSFLSLPAILLGPFLSFAICSYFLTHKKKIQCGFLVILGTRNYMSIKRVIRSRTAKTNNFLISYSMIYLITFTESVIILFLLHVSYPIVTALLITISDIFPILGPGTIFLPLCIYRLMCGNAVQAIGLFAGWILITVNRQIVEPRLISKITKTPIVVMFFSIYISLLTGNFWYIPYSALFCFLYQLFSEAGLLHKNSAE